MLLFYLYVGNNRVNLMSLGGLPELPVELLDFQTLLLDRFLMPKNRLLLRDKVFLEVIHFLQ